MGAAGDNIAGNERAVLEEQHAQLRKKISGLKREQDFLLFQKAMYSADSKYLVINVLKRTAQLKFKNRVLMDFRYRASKKFPRRGPRQGKLVLTKKEEGKNGRHALVFGTSLVVQGKRAAVTPDEARIPSIVFPKKEMQSVYYAVEEGALAYVVR